MTDLTPISNSNPPKYHPIAIEFTRNLADPKLLVKA
jgi:hypothetical protein